jgi:DNA-binding transcriptional ArsR family regulator
MWIEIKLGYRRNMTAPAQPVSSGSVTYETDIALAAALIADPTRAAILRALLPDRPLAAGELARLAGVSAATASFHLAKLLEGGMIVVARQGRHRYYRLAGYEVASALEALGLAAAITSRMFELGWIERGFEKGQRRRGVRITAGGDEGLAARFGFRSS